MAPATGHHNRRLVVGFDGSEAAVAALEWAAGLAGSTGADVEVVTTWSWPSGYGASLVIPTDYDPEGDAEDMVARAVDEARGRHPDVRFVPVVIEGRTAPVLVEASNGADLLALGTRGHGAVAGMLLGSVGEHCVAHAHCPVLVIGGHPPARAA
ncbi:MAG TPA: universal stress protein [Acidimicrobiales bacterium]